MHYRTLSSLCFSMPLRLGIHCSFYLEHITFPLPFTLRPTFINSPRFSRNVNEGPRLFYLLPFHFPQYSLHLWLLWKQNLHFYLIFVKLNLNTHIWIVVTLLYITELEEKINILLLQGIRFSLGKS